MAPTPTDDLRPGEDPRGLLSSPGELRPPVATSRMSRGEEAARYIRGLIFDGELRPGTRVPQDDIARVLGVSRIPVREALIALEREGWVTIELNRGAFVNTLDARAILDHYELYGMIYGFAARRALDRGDAPELIEHLEAIVKQLGTTDGSAEVLTLSLAFQRTIVEAAHSPRLRPLTRALTQLVPGDFFTLVPEAVDLERKGLRAVLRALEARRRREGRRRVHPHGQPHRRTRADPLRNARPTPRNPPEESPPADPPVGQHGLAGRVQDGEGAHAVAHVPRLHGEHLPRQDRGREAALDGAHPVALAVAQRVQQHPAGDAVRAQAVEDGPVEAHRRGEGGIAVERVAVSGEAVEQRLVDARGRGQLDVGRALGHEVALGDGADARCRTRRRPGCRAR